MPDKNWPDGLNELIGDFVDWLCKFFGADDEDEYIGTALPKEKIDIEIHLSVRVKRK